jgi:uncharacterized membrane protein
MAINMAGGSSGSIHPLHAVMLAGSVPLFLGAWLSDAAYSSSYEIQWSNFASWLLVGALVFSGIALVFAAVDLGRPERRARGAVAYALVLLAGWLVGLFDAFMHARDAWASMPAGLWMSVIAALLACVATWLGFRSLRFGAAT